MANLIGIQIGTPIVWADVTDYVSTLSGLTRTHQIDLTGILDGAARQGAKADMASIATTHLAQRFSVLFRIEMDVAPADGAYVALYWSSSPSATAGTGNDGACTGADAAYTGSAGSTVDETVLQLQHVGTLMLTNDADTIIQQATFITTLPQRYGMPVVVNHGGQAFEGDAVEMCIGFTPLEDEAQ
jgi:hypothetical protein